MFKIEDVKLKKLRIAEGYNYKSFHILISVTYKWTERFLTPKLDNHFNTALLCQVNNATSLLPQI